jgi:CRP/FNR family transcriptional regulator, cyclic AMP receptor protein
MVRAMSSAGGAAALSTVPQTEKRRFLEGNPLFQAFPPVDLDRLAAHLVERRCADGQMIFGRGDPGTSMMIVVEGRVRIGVTAPSGREVLLNIIEPGQIFGEMTLLDGKARSADATAFGPCLLLMLDRRDVLPVIRQSPDVAIRLLEILCGRIRRTSEQLEGIALFALTSRLARLLLTLAESHGQQAGGGTRIDAALSQRDLGQLIGASREKVNVQLGRWVADGYIARDGGAIVILDSDALTDIADAVED